MKRYELSIVAYEDGKEPKVIDTFDFSQPKPSASGKLNMHAGGKVVLEGDRWQVGANITKIATT